MDYKRTLLKRLDEVSESVRNTDNAAAFLALGSVGKETVRIDRYSDLDFFVIAKSGCKMRFVNETDWLEAAHPVGFHFLNTPDGRKVLFTDGIYAEFAVFEEAELPNQTFAEGRIIWQNSDFNADMLAPRVRTPAFRAPSSEFALGEMLTNLYVGLGRYARGEKLSGTRFIQGYAVDMLIASVHFIFPENNHLKDPFQNERRLEQRYPEFAATLPQMLQGYDRCPESALAVLKFLEEHFEVNEFISSEIRKLAVQILTGDSNSE